MTIQKKTNRHLKNALSSDAAFGGHEHLLASLIEIKPSRLLLLWVISLHVCALTAVLMANLVVIIQCAIMAGLLLSLYYFSHQWLLCPNYYLQQHQRGWRLINQKNPADVFIITHCYYWSQYLVIYRVKTPSLRTVYFSIFCDSTSEQDFHLLKVISRYFI